MTNEKAKEGKTYKNKVVYLRLSKVGEHVYAFNVESKDEEGVGTGEMALGEKVESLIANRKEVEAVLSGSAEYAKISVLPVKEGNEVENLVATVKEVKSMLDDSAEKEEEKSSSPSNLLLKTETVEYKKICPVCGEMLVTIPGYTQPNFCRHCDEWIFTPEMLIKEKDEE